MRGVQLRKENKTSVLLALKSRYIHTGVSQLFANSNRELCTLSKYKRKAIFIRTAVA